MASRQRPEHLKNPPRLGDQGDRQSADNFVQAVEPLPDGSRAVRLTGDGTAAMQEQVAFARQKYLDVWGREMTDDDLLFPDYSLPQPGPLSPEKHKQLMAEAMEAAGVAPRCIHAYQATGFILTPENERLVSAEDRARWLAAAAEYDALHD